MNKRQISILALFMALVIAVPAISYATVDSATTTDDVNSTDKQQMIEAEKERLREQKAEMLQQQKEDDQAAKEQLREQNQEHVQVTQEIQNQFREQLREIKQKMIENSDRFEEGVQNKREELRQLIEEKRQRIQEHVQNIQDRNKQELILRIDQNVDLINQRLVNHFTDVVNHLDAVLERIINQTDQAEANGADVSSVRDTIVNAQSALSDARDAIEAQSGKTYEIDIVDDATLQQNAQDVRRQLHDDLQTTKTSVKQAADAVRTALQALKSVTGDTTTNTEGE